MNPWDMAGYFSKVSRSSPLWEPEDRRHSGAQGATEEPTSVPEEREKEFAVNELTRLVQTILVLGAPIFALLLRSSALGEDAFTESAVSDGLFWISEWVSPMALIVWVLVAAIWLVIYLFSGSGHHRLKPLHEVLLMPTVILLVTAAASILPYVMLPPWGSNV